MAPAALHHFLGIFAIVYQESLRSTQAVIRSPPRPALHPAHTHSLSLNLPPSIRPLWATAMISTAL